MLLYCPECQLDCTIDERSADTFSCPGCGILLYSKSAQALKVGVAAEVAPTGLELEKTRQWRMAVEEVLPSAKQLPFRLGRYEVVAHSGTGAFADVYLAYDTHLERDVALKVPRLKAFMNSERIAQFLDEARVGAKLEHPGIVRVYDVGWLLDEVGFISMEHLPGGTLKSQLALEKPTVHRAATLISHLASAIHYAHTQGLVHRDLKPSNILFGSDGLPRIADFGLALPESQQFEHAGEIAGTIPYMSPEQIRGESHRLDGRSDVWSLGAIFYQLLTGRRPFNGDAARISDEILHREPKPPRQIDDSIPKPLEDICLKCLQKSISERYTSARDLSSDLEAWLTPEIPRSNLAASPAVAGPSSAKKFVDRRMATWAVSLVAGSLLLWGAVDAFAPAGANGRKLADENPAVAFASELNASIDDFVLLRPYSLLDREPRKIWKADANDILNRDPGKGLIHASTATQMLADFGTTDAEEYILTIDFLKNVLAGRTGLFWGYQVDERTTVATYSLAYLACYPPDKRGDKFRYNVEVGCVRNSPVLKPSPKLPPLKPGEKPRMTGSHVWEIQSVNPPNRTGNSFELHVKGHEIRSVRWNGEELRELVAELAKPKQRADPYQPNTPGRFGVYLSSGEATFVDVRVKVLQKSQKQ